MTPARKLPAQTTGRPSGERLALSVTTGPAGKPERLS
jgi:hypothetical protein